MTKVVERPQAKTLARAVTSLTIYHLATTSFLCHDQYTTAYLACQLVIVSFGLIKVCGLSGLAGKDNRGHYRGRFLSLIQPCA